MLLTVFSSEKLLSSLLNIEPKISEADLKSNCITEFSKSCSSKLISAEKVSLLAT